MSSFIEATYSDAVLEISINRPEKRMPSPATCTARWSGRWKAHSRTTL